MQTRKTEGQTLPETEASRDRKAWKRPEVIPHALANARHTSHLSADSTVAS